MIPRCSRGCSDDLGSGAHADDGRAFAAWCGEAGLLDGKWTTRHKSDAFKVTRPFAVTALVNAAGFWRREQLGIELTPGLAYFVAMQLEYPNRR